MKSAAKHIAKPELALKQKLTAKQKTIFTVQIILCTVALLLLCVALLLNPFSPIYSSAIESNPNEFVMGVPQTMIAAHQIVDYLWFGTPYKIDLSEQAVAHMKDVKSLFRFGEWTILAALLIFFCTVRKNSLKEVRKIILSSTLWAIGLLWFIALICVVGFDSFDAVFIEFHHIFFSNALWLFPANDSLILYFPEYFFSFIAGQIFFWTTVLLSIILLFLKLKERQERLSSSEPAQHI